MSINKEFVQFAPSRENTYYPGVFGWGVDTNGFRIVVFGPAEADHPAVKSFVTRGEKFADEVDGIKIPKHTGSRLQYTSEEKYKKCLNAGEHGPCHVHVFDIKSGRETRFELIEHYKQKQHFAKQLHFSEERDTGLTDRQIEAVQPILNYLTPDFIQRWREMYQDNRLSGYVSRVVKRGKDDMIETMQRDGSTRIYDPKSDTTAVIPVSSEISQIPLTVLRPHSGDRKR